MVDDKQVGVAASAELERFTAADGERPDGRTGNLLPERLEKVCEQP
jgi:hypothetical protein